jgi:polysaccharide export outer membrane protein
MKPMNGFRAATFLLLVSAISFTGCATKTINAVNFPEAPPLPEVTLIEPGDQIEVNFRYWPELNTTQTVRQDGMISLQLIDDVKVGGMTPEQADEQITKLYEGELVDPVLTVIVQTNFNDRIFVGGQVNAPGVIVMPTRLTALEAIFEAGGFDWVSAEAETVLVIRHVDGKRYVKTLNLEKALEEPETDAFYLAPSDIVYVPRTKIFKANQFVDQYIDQIIPDIATQAITFYAFGRAGD